MKNKTCGKCKYFVKNDIDNGCQAIGVESHFTADVCKNFDPIYKPTNGDRIRQGGDVALINFYAMERCKICAFNGTDRCNQTECAYGLAEWLKQEAKDE